MDEQVTHDPILARFRAALDEIYGARLERVVLFGSRAVARRQATWSTSRRDRLQTQHRVTTIL
jgi:hypothetical protein